jgi:NAD(P)-dependent dehydrogenase (short-subunit alcohol dehydrogenase family)
VPDGRRSQGVAPAERKRVALALERLVGQELARRRVPPEVDVALLEVRARPPGRGHPGAGTERRIPMRVVEMVVGVRDGRDGLTRERLDARDLRACRGEEGIAMSESSDGRVVVVTGAAGNLGAAVAGALRRDGARTVLVDHSAQHLAALYGESDQDPARLVVGGVDLASEAAVGAVTERARARFGAIDALVHTVGTFAAGKTVHEESLDTWDLLLRLNVRTALLTARAVLPEMLQRGRGAIVTVASRHALAGPAGAAAYSASKGALLRLTESLAQEAKSRGVTANCVLPGTLDTPQNRAAMPASEWATMVEPAAVADVIAFLVSPGARAVTGAAIPVYGRG